jgi:stearoyl-CoA desaturase (delta-9 desaturase)
VNIDAERVAKPTIAAVASCKRKTLLKGQLATDNKERRRPTMATETSPAKVEVHAPASTVLPGVVRASPAAARRERRLALLVVFGPLLGTVAAIALLWGWAIGVTELVLLVVLYSLSVIGVNIGYHRLVAHRAFQTTTPVRVLLTVCGGFSGQGPVLYWVANHRRHHKYSDQPGDPHSPHLHGDGFWGLIKGFWHVHLGWLFTNEVSDWRYWVPDLLRDRALFRLNQWYFAWLLLGLALPAAIGGLVSWSWQGAVLGLLWGGLVRMFLHHQSAWAINSVTHLWGTRPFQTHDHSRNNALVALLTYGEGWHNNHHAFPTSAFNDLRWWQLDVNALLIRGLRLCGLAWDVKCPSRETVRQAWRPAEPELPSSH